MVKKKYDLLNIEIGTFKRSNDKLSIKIDKSQFRYDSLSELNELKKHQENFIDLDSIVEQENQVILTYKLSKNAKSLKELTKEKKAIRTSIAKRIMNQDILKDDTYRISLNPANIWYYPMNHVWYVYKANEAMPFDDNFSPLMKYKALVLYCLTGIAYERLLNEPKEALINNQDPIILQVLNSENIEDLKLAINSIDDSISYQEWQKVDTKEKKTKRKFIITASSIAIVGLLLVGMVHKNDQKKLIALEDKQKIELTKLKYSSMVQSSLDNKNWKEASEAMKKAGYSKEKQTQTFLSLKEYQEAINADPKELNTVVNEIYKNNDKKVVLDLELPTGTEEKIDDELKIEKAIVSYDSETLASQLSFEENKDILLRMGQAFLENNDMQDAQSVQTKLFGLDETKGDYLKSMIDLQTATDKVKDSQKKLDEANKIDNKDKSKGDKVKVAKSNLDSAKKDEKLAKDKVDSLKNKIGA